MKQKWTKSVHFGSENGECDNVVGMVDLTLTLTLTAGGG